MQGVREAAPPSPLAFVVPNPGGLLLFHAREDTVLKPAVGPAHNGLGEAVDDGVLLMAPDSSAERRRRTQAIFDILAEILDKLADARLALHLRLGGVPYGCGDRKE